MSSVFMVLLYHIGAAAPPAVSPQGRRIIEKEDSLVIKGVETLSGGTVPGHNDHRIVMMAAAAACISLGDVVITGCEAVNKSYPKFFEDYVSLGGEVTCL